MILEKNLKLLPSLKTQFQFKRKSLAKLDQLLMSSHSFHFAIHKKTRSYIKEGERNFAPKGGQNLSQIGDK